MKTQIHLFLAAAILLTLNIQPSTAFAQGTAFTYQGQLNNGGAPANGSYDLTFSLYTNNTGGAAIAGPVTNSIVGVTNGLFTTLVDFGNVFNGSSNWLEIAVSASGANSFMTLMPRQQVTPTPYAIYAENVNGLSIQQNSNGAPDIVEGSPINYVSSGVVGATIAGGGVTNYYGLIFSNSVTADFGTVSGGANNIAGNEAATVGGGANNTASGAGATVGGGDYNIASNYYATVGGGYQNTAGGEYATVGGGNSNDATNYGATVPGGVNNIAGGQYSFAVGYNAQATNDGAFVWSDGTGTTTASTNNNSVTFRASGGYRLFTSSGNAGVSLAANATSWATISDQNAKKNFAPVNGETVLDKLAQVPVEKWNYKWEKDNATPNIGPMAQAFKAAFYPGRDDKSITTLEFDGVELAAIQGLNEKVEARSQESESRIQNLETENAELKARLDRLEKMVSDSTSKH